MMYGLQEGAGRRGGLPDGGWGRGPFGVVGRQGRRGGVHARARAPGGEGTQGKKPEKEAKRRASRRERQARGGAKRSRAGKRGWEGAATDAGVCVGQEVGASKSVMDTHAGCRQRSAKGEETRGEQGRGEENRRFPCVV